MSEIDYTHGYFKEMSPLHLELCDAEPARRRMALKRPPRYLEFGSARVFRSTSTQRRMAASSGARTSIPPRPPMRASSRQPRANVKVLDQSFAELAARDDLPEFDVIALHAASGAGFRTRTAASSPTSPGASLRSAVFST